MKKNLYLILAAVSIVAATWLIISLVAGRGAPKGPSLTSLYNEAKALDAKEAYLNAQAIYSNILDKVQDDELAKNVREDLERVNTKILFSPLATEDSFVYTVEKGDTLGKIAKKFNTTVGLIMRSNKL
ncbi:MAG: LysM peptidoglycan-binding domain-containing protein, partial [Candidatus Omnitrophota bacterium]